MPSPLAGENNCAKIILTPTHQNCAMPPATNCPENFRGAFRQKAATKWQKRLVLLPQKKFNGGNKRHQDPLEQVLRRRSFPPPLRKGFVKGKYGMP
jgi:hypothetical protein